MPFCLKILVIHKITDYLCETYLHGVKKVNNVTLTVTIIILVRCNTEILT